MKRSDAEEYTTAIKQIIDGVVRVVDVSPALGISDALGLSPDEWLERRLAGPVRLTRDERRAIVAANPKTSSRELAAAVGVDHATILNDRKAGEKSPPTGEKSPPPKPKPKQTERELRAERERVTREVTTRQLADLCVLGQNGTNPDYDASMYDAIYDPTSIVAAAALRATARYCTAVAKALTSNGGKT